MKKVSIITISISIIIGFAIHGIIGHFTKTNISKLESLAKINYEILKVTPKVFEINEKQIIQIPEFTIKNNNTIVIYKFYNYENNKLVKIQVKNSIEK